MKTLLIVILSVSNLACLAFILFYAKQQLMMLRAFHELQGKLAAALELYVVNDNAQDRLSKRTAFDEIQVGIIRSAPYWKQFPPSIATLAKAINSWMERQIAISRPAPR